MPYRERLPSFITDVFDDTVARRSLLVGSVALVAAALDPKVYGPALPSVQAAIRDRPQIEFVVVLLAVAGAALLLAGGAIGDSVRARPIIVGGLVVSLLASLVGIVVTSGPLFIASRLVGHAAVAFVIPVSIALVATSYHGVARATAIGVAYGAYGAAGAADLILLQLVPGVSAPAFIVSAVACGAAIWVARDRISDLPRAVAVERPYIVGTAIWAFGMIAVTVGVTWISAAWENPFRWGLIVLGLVLVALALVHDRVRIRPSAGKVRIERRPVAVAVFVGVVLAISQTAPMLQLPLYFRLVLGYGPFLATVALAPLFAALVLAGPVAGFLLTRFTPRWLVGAGVMAVGLGNLALALVMTTDATYLAFVIPSALVGAGFVIGTTVRTAIIFASVPRGLPATAAALNEASILIGSRVGIVVVTSIVAQVALATYAASVAGLPAAEAESAIDAFSDVLVTVGLPSFSQIAMTIDAADLQPYADAYASGVRAALVLGGAAAVIAGIVALLALGQRDPLSTVWEYTDERVVTPAD